MKPILENALDAGRSCIAIHSNDYFYAAGTGGVVKRYNRSLTDSSWQLSNTLDDPTQYHDDPINEICFSASGDYFALCSDDGEVALLRHPSNSVQSVLCKFDCGVSSISFDLSSQYSFLLAMSSDTGTIKIVNALQYAAKYYEFKCHPDGIRHIRFIPFCPDPFKMSREKYIAIAQNNAAFSIWKVLASNVFDAEKPADDKVVKAHEFEGVFPKIKGGDNNQRLLFDSTRNGHFIAIPGNTNIKMLDTRSMTFVETKDLTHNAVTNCCAFNQHRENAEEQQYVLATGDIAGNLAIWSLKYENDSLTVSAVDKCSGQSGGICEMVWKDETELVLTSMNGAILQYHLEMNQEVKTATTDTVESEEVKEEETASTGTMDVDKENTNTLNADSQPEEKKKGRFDDESDEDFDIDMGDEEGTGKVVLRKTVEAATVPDSKPDTLPEPEPATKTESGGPSADAKGTGTETVNGNGTGNGTGDRDKALQDELAAAEALFGDDAEDPFDDVPIVKTKSTESNKMEAEDMGMDTTADPEEKDSAMEDTGEDLDGFIVDDNKPKKEEAAEVGMAVDDEVDADPFGGRSGMNEMDYAPPAAIHDPFVNGSTEYDDEGQRYLMFNEICGVTVRRQDASTNPMEMNNIMNSLNNRKYAYELEFFDKSRYSRAVHLKSDHHFVCCDVNEFGVLLGSEPSMELQEDAEGKESIVRYKPISRNGEYRAFASEKDCEWTTRLPLGEHCVAVGLSPKFALIATNRRYLRILSVGGLQTNTVIRVPLNVIHIAGTTQDTGSNIVAITFEDLSLWILDLDTNQRLHEGKVAISAESRLTRIFMMGTAADYKVVTVDSEGIVSLLSNTTFGCSWVVILDIDDYLSRTYPAGSETTVAAEMRPKGVWPIYFDRDEHKLMTLELKFLEHPVPSQADGYVLMDYPLSVPLLNMGPDEVDVNTGDTIVMFGNREEEMMTNAVCHQFNGSKTPSAAIKQQRKQLLKDYLMLFGHSCKSGKTVVAYDIALHFLDSEKALSSAIKVAMHHSLPLLAEQLSNLAKKRLDRAQSIKQQQMKQQGAVSVRTETQNGAGTPNAGKANGARNITPGRVSSIKKPSRSLGRLKRPTAKLAVNRKNSNESVGMEDMTTTMQRTQLIGNKRPNNPCKGGNSEEPPKKRNYVGNSNPFSSSGAQRQTKKSSLFSM